MSESDSKSQPEYWSVETNNYMQNADVIAINDSNLGMSSLQIGVGTPLDPAVGCAKNFTASYTCGTSSTLNSVNLDAEASGKVATFDCDKQAAVCTGGRLYIEDTGNATLKDYAGNIVWQSNTNTTGLALEDYSAAKTKYKRNYLEAGEFLRVGEKVGSPSGNCYLYCGGSDSSGKLKLQINYQILGCNKPGEDPDNNSYGEYGYVNGDSNSSASATYSMQQDVQNHNLQGSVGYSDNDMNIREYPTNLITLGNGYFDLGNYDTPNVSNLENLESTDVDGCREACNARDDCYGFVMNNTNNSCFLKPKDNYPTNLKRVYDENTTLYVRKMKVNNDSSCTTDINQTYGQIYANMPKGSDMTEETLCQLGDALSEQLEIVSKKEEALQTQLDKVTNDITKLNSQNNTLDSEMLSALKQLEKESEEYKRTLSETVKEKERLQNSEAMEETSNLDMVSSNMQFMAWTALAALLVAGSIKASR